MGKKPTDDAIDARLARMASDAFLPLILALSSPVNPAIGVRPSPSNRGTVGSPHQSTCVGTSVGSGPRGRLRYLGRGDGAPASRFGGPSQRPKALPDPVGQVGVGGRSATAARCGVRSFKLPVCA